MDGTGVRVENRHVQADPASALAAAGSPPVSAGRLRVARGTDARVAYIRAAFLDDRLRLAAQPIVDLRTGEGAGEELLLRLVRPNGLTSLPGPYLLAAERYPRLMLEIDTWVVDRAAELAAPGRRVQVNLSGWTVAQRAFSDRIEAALERYGTEPSLLTFEITETAAALGSNQAATCADGIVALGSRLALDDFGTGYGAFTYLHRLPVSMIKIDREFVTDLATNPRSRGVVQGIVDIATRLGLTTVAEGVEDAATLGLLRDCAVDRAQGFHLGRPAPCE
jgi:EAL domain-containing protein (putative c-di-GMP-specific phosphodiesterase class I)